MAFNNDTIRVNLDNTRVIFNTNFSGDPARDTYGDDRRKCNLIIPSKEQAKDLTKKGFKVKATKPRANDDPNTFEPEYYLMVQIKYRKRDRTPVKYPPNVFLVVGNNPPLALTEETVGCLDHIRIKNVNAVLTSWTNDDGTLSAGVRTIYVEQDLDDDPYAARYAQRTEAGMDDSEEIPF